MSLAVLMFKIGSPPVGPFRDDWVALCRSIAWL